MDFEKIYVVEPLHRSSSELDWTTLNKADVIFLEGLHRGYSPLAYQLKNEAFEADVRNLKHDLSRLSSNDFVFVGEVQGIDKKKKVIYLVNGGTLSYKHLIATSGSNVTQAQHEREFALALRALADALLVQQVPPATALQSIKALLNKKILASMKVKQEKSNDVTHVAQDYLPQDQDSNSHSLSYSHSFNLQL